MGRKNQSVETLRAIALRELEGVGSPALGEWSAMVNAFHLRRRLTPAEQEHTGPAVDIRSSRAEVHRRLASVRGIVGMDWKE